jgi:hypothetical protein
MHRNKVHVLSRLSVAIKVPKELPHRAPNECKTSGLSHSLQFHS